MKRKLPIHAILGAALCMTHPALLVAKDNGNPLLEPKTVFVTSESYTGDLVGEAQILLGMPFADGLEAADAICQFHAQLGGLNGRYVAILSTSTVSAASRLTPTVGPYRLPNGVPVANSFAGLFSTRLDNILGPAVNLISPLDANESGMNVSGPDAVAWTGTGPSGELDQAAPGGPFSSSPSPGKSFCFDWTDNTQPAELGCHHSISEQQPCGLAGNARTITTDWTHSEYEGCNRTKRLYCAQR